LISAIFSIKSFWDNRTGVNYSKKLQVILDKLDADPYSRENQSLHTERMEIQKKLSEQYGFPKLFFLSLVLVNVILAFWGLKVISKIPQVSTIARRSSLRLILALVVFFITILCFFLLEYHQVVRFGWAFILLLFQWTLLGFVFAFGISEEVYDTVMGYKKDKDIIEGPPPPAW
jgi:hypothetical protein